MNGVTPSVDTVAKGEYPVSRPLYFYVKNAHLDVIPGLQEYIEFFVSDEMAGPDGPLCRLRSGSRSGTRQDPGNGQEPYPDGSA